MRELATLTFVTLDGVIEAPRSPAQDGSGNFTGWAAPHWDAVMEQVGREAMAVPYDLLLGRKTYELFAAHFPDAGDDHPMNTATKFVATNTLNELGWRNSVRIGGDVPAEVARLKEQDGLLLQVHGSGQLIQTLLAHELVDELRLWVFPVVAGSGQRLFAEGTVPANLELVKSEVGSTGVVMAVYRWADW